MKKILATLMVMFVVAAAYCQTTYYWVGGTGGNINAGANWNSSLDGSGSTRPSSSGATDILVFDGTNLGGATTVTTPITVNANAGITAGQMFFVNGAKVSFIRSSSGTSTLNLSGGAGDDFIVEAGSSFSITSTVGSVVIAMAASNTGRVSGDMAMVTTLQARIANTTSGSPGSLIFTSGSTFTTNITSSSSAYAFGNSTQSSEGWVVFESGSHLYYNGGYSPNGSGSQFSAIDMKPGSVWHHRASNTFSGNFFNRKSFGDVIVENNATLTAQGAIYSIGNLTITPGSSFMTHSSGETVILGNLVANGDMLTPAASTNQLVMGGTSTQTISGTGIIDVGGLVIGDNATVVLQKNVRVEDELTILGQINFNTYKVSGPATFKAVSSSTAAGTPGSAQAGKYFISNTAGINSGYIGMTITGPGISPNTTVVSLSSTEDSVYISQPVLTTMSGNFNFYSDGAVLETGSPNGFDPATGSIAITGNQTFQDNINYIINAATTTPLGISTGSSGTHVGVHNVILNAPVTTNTSTWVSGALQLNAGKLTIRSTDTLRVLTGATVTGAFSSANYFVTDVNSTGAAGVFRIDGVTGSTLLPIGTANYYLPATANPPSASDFAAFVFTGITKEGTPTGMALTANEKKTKVNAVWDINRVNGNGSTGLELKWDAALEGSAFATLPDNEIGIIVNQNPGWTLPVGTGDNANDVASASFDIFGKFSIGALPPSDPFLFNPIPDKTYGDPDFDAGVISLNTTTPVSYTSSNPAVATIVNNRIHIVGTGTTTITAMQASDGFYPAANVSQPLLIIKTPLTIKADDKVKPEGDQLPVLTITYTGFVYGENSAVLTTQPSISTTATASSPPGTYPITVSGAAAKNYSITYVNGTMTITPRQQQVITFPDLPTKTYGNADFPGGASSSNNTIPVAYTSSNPSVATIAGNNIHLVGAGTTVITASQAGSPLFFPATNVSKTLVVNKANLTVKAVDTSKVQGQPNPNFDVTYTGFVLGENQNSLQTIPTAATSAVQNSAPGYYPIIPGGGVSNKYNFNYVEGRFTILPATGTAEPHLQAFMSSSNTLTVRVYSAEPDLANIILFDATGRPVITKNAFLPKGFGNIYISVSNVASGLYTVQVNGKIVKLKKNISIAR